MKTQGKEAVKEAGREYHAIDKAWSDAKTKREKATLKRMEAEKKARKEFKQFNEAMIKLIFP